MLYTEADGFAFAHARTQGRVLIDGGLFTPIKEDGITVGVEPTAELLELFSEPPPADRLFDVLVRFSLYHDMVHDHGPMTEVVDELRAMGMRKGESGTLWKAVRRGLCVP
ncbi:hypothetical protein [Paludisphaera mucosa]|uniref:Uncharacterized protein n=1 Tax=Paludisphaera mucosa TaxID=3030827 RepID=A0ABT6FFS4_9BACT|nr:hypothetical protein [Paludisphaera mucosa]MDG3006427.1 hypothetical protein [Paludisphaera mucosa]